MKNVGLIANIFFILLSCNNGNKGESSSTQKSDSTQYVSVDTFYLDTNEVNSDYDIYEENDSNSDRELDDLLLKIKKGEVKVLFHGIITEPFWDVYLMEKEMLVVDAGNNTQTIFNLKSTFDKKLDSQIISYSDRSGLQKELIIKKESAGDGMSDRTYPYSLLIDDWQGGGDVKLIRN